MKPVVQEEKIGCAIASAAAIARVSYQDAKRIANGMEIYANDSALWSQTDYIRSLLRKMGIKTGDREIPFTSWEKPPDLRTDIDQMASSQW